MIILPNVIQKLIFVVPYIKKMVNSSLLFMVVDSVIESFIDECIFVIQFFLLNFRENGGYEAPRM